MYVSVALYHCVSPSLSVCASVFLSSCLYFSITHSISLSSDLVFYKLFPIRVRTFSPHPLSLSPQIGSVGAQAIARAAAAHPSLICIDLRNNAIECAGAAALVPLLHAALAADPNAAAPNSPSAASASAAASAVSASAATASAAATAGAAFGASAGATASASGAASSAAFSVPAGDSRRRRHLRELSLAGNRLGDDAAAAIAELIARGAGGGFSSVRRRPQQRERGAES
jgi:hypothetical protein